MTRAEDSQVIDPPTRLLRRGSLWLGAAGWASANLALLAIGGGHLPFHASTLADPPAPGVIARTDLMFLEVFGLMAIVQLLTRRRVVPDVASRVPSQAVAARETRLMIGYGLLAMAGGYLLGRGLGWHAIGFHLDGMVVRTGQPVVPVEAITWAAYNLTAYAVLPLIYFRRRYSREQLNLRSADRRADLLVVIVVLVIESTVQLSLNAAILHLTGRQILIGAPLTFLLSFAGTVLPTMVFVACVLTPRYLKLTGSVPASVILGGLTYAALHVFDGWTSFRSPVDALLSVLFVLLFYTGPGMFKAFITIRTANAWTHVWAYHAIAPHTLLDTNMFVKIFGIR
ncbi:hypothetical protein ACIA58_06030 [Kribbella sp. NPDC051586]|uniref:hypothetical protein n=1 Tax=Kribbella sp. NPDC051586 TaxID=3364118 RepID=UPI0037A2E05D